MFRAGWISTDVSRIQISIPTYTVVDASPYAVSRPMKVSATFRIRFVAASIAVCRAESDVGRTVEKEE